MYDIDLEKCVNKIKENNAKIVLIQLPDGIKPKAKEIQQTLEKHTDAQILIWGGSCFGACDIPLEAKNIGVDLILHFGHNEFIRG